MSNAGGGGGGGKGAGGGYGPPCARGGFAVEGEGAVGSEEGAPRGGGVFKIGFGVRASSAWPSGAQSPACRGCCGGRRPGGAALSPVTRGPSGRGLGSGTGKN